MIGAKIDLYMGCAKMDPKTDLVAFQGILGAEVDGMGVILGAGFIYDHHFYQNFVEMHHPNLNVLLILGISGPSRQISDLREPEGDG